MSFFDEDDDPHTHHDGPAFVQPHRPAAAGRSPAGPPIPRPCWSGGWSPASWARSSCCCCSSSSARATTRAATTRCATTTARSRARDGLAADRRPVLQADGRRQLAPRRRSSTSRSWATRARPTTRSSRPRSSACPDDMASAQQSLLILLELRRDGLASIAEQIRTALGDEGEAADRAIEAIAGDMRAFDASDVLYDPRVIPFIKAAFRTPRSAARTIAASQFLKEISWVSPGYVASRLDQQLSTDAGDGDGGDRDPNEPTGPGLHGTGLDATSYGSVTLQPGDVEPPDLRRGPAVHRRLHQPGRERRVQRQGHAADPAPERQRRSRSTRPSRRSPRARRPPSSSRSTASRRSAPR